MALVIYLRFRKHFLIRSVKINQQQFKSLVDENGYD